jgi:xanthosine utilization system XapX-like protein
MKKSKKFHLILVVSGLIVLLMDITVKNFFEEQDALVAVALFLMVAYLVMYVAGYIIPNIYKVVKYRDEPWPQEHKILWVLIGIGIAQNVLIMWPVIMSNGFNTATIIRLIVSSFVLGVSEGKIEVVDDERLQRQKSRKKEEQEVEQEDEETRM